MKHLSFLTNSTRDFDGGRTGVDTMVTTRSLFRKTLLFLAFILLPMTGWGQTVTYPSASGSVDVLTKVSNGGRCRYLADGCYTFRPSSGYSFSNGIKTQNNQGGVVFYISAQTNVKVFIKHTEAKNAHDVTCTVNSISATDYATFYGATSSADQAYTMTQSATSYNFTVSVDAKSETFSAEKTLPAGYYALVPSGSKGNTIFNKISFTSAAAKYTVTFNAKGGTCGTSSLKEESAGKGVTLPTATPASATTQEFKGWAESDGETDPTKIFAAGTTYKPSKDITLYAIYGAKTTKSPITYAETKGADMSAYPTQYTEGVGIASFADLADVPGFFFTGWNPSSIGTSAKGDQTITAQWEEDSRCFIFTKTGQPTSGNLAAGDVITATGGSMKVYSTKTTSSLKWASDGLNFSGGQADQVEIKLTKLLSVGTTIKLTLKSNKLDILDKTGAVVATIENPGSTYTVKANDGLAGTVTFRLRRNGSTYLQGVEVANCGGEASFHTVSFDMNGATSAAIANQSVLDGDKATKPADPTKTDHVFKGWVIASTGAAYDFNATVTADVALKAKWAALHTITYAETKGADMSAYPTTYEEGVGVASFTALSDIEGFKFLGWNPSSIPATATDNQTITAQWQEAITYTVTYYDGTVVMGSETVAQGGAPTASEIDTKKAGYIFKNWCSDPELQNAVVLSELQITAATSLYAKYEKAYALSVDFASLAGGSTSVADVLAANYYTHVGTNTSWDNNTSSNNGAYQGLKMKASGTTIDFDVPANKLVAFKAGVMVNSKSDMYKDGTKVAENMTGGSISTGANFKMYYFYKADADAHYQFVTTSGDAQVIKAITITDPYKVTLDATTAGGEAVEPLYFTGTALNLPTAVKTDWTFAGWFDNAELTGDPVVSPYTPSGNITLYAKFTQLSEDVSLKSLKYGETSITLVANQYTYNVELPYKAVVEVPVVTAEKNDAKATMSEITQATAVPGQATFTVTAENTAVFANYVINFTKGPKDGVCLIKGQVTGENKVTITVGEGTGAASGIKNTSTFGEQTGYKFNNRPAYIGVALSDERHFQKGDVVNVFVTTTYAGPINLWYGMEPTQKMAEASTNMVQGVNTIVLTEDPETDAIYLCRGAQGQANENWNPYVAYIEVMRPMNPTITGISFNGVAAVVNNDANPKTITATVPYSTDFSAITVVDTIISNDNSKVTKNYPSTWVEGDNTITLTDKDGDATTYTVTLTKAAASSDATLKSLSVEGYTLDPAFSAETLVYTIERAYKDKDAELPAISYEVNYAAATAVKTTEGKVVTITVTAEDGTTQKAYTITFTNKAASTDATLKSLMYGDKAITLVADQYTYNVNLPYGTTDVPALTAVKNDELASDPVINNATAFVDFQATSTATVTAESGDEQVYTVNFTVAEFPSVAIFDGSTMEAIATSPDATTGLSWSYTGLSSVSNKVVTVNGKEYLKGQKTGGSTKSSRYLKVSVPANYLPKFYLVAYTTGDGERTMFIDDEISSTATNKYLAVVNSDASNPAFGYSAFLEDNKDYYINATDGMGILELSVELKAVDPKCEVPAITAQPESNTQFGTGDMTTSVTASVTDGGTLSYQWYNASDDSEVAGATAATLTTTTEGSYYVIITNTLADHRDNFVKSETAQLGYRKLDDATLSALGYGETAITLVDAQYAYEVELAKGTTEVPALTATTSSPYATKVITDATAFVDYKATSTVVVTAEDLTTQLTYTVNFTVRHDVELQDVTSAIIWDFAKAATEQIQLKSDEGEVKKGEFVVMANIPNVTNNSDFESSKIKFGGEYIHRSDDGTKYPSCGNHILFKTTIPGAVTVTFADNGSNNRQLDINGTLSQKSSSKTDYQTYTQYVEAGDVEIKGYQEGKNGLQYVRFFKIEFTPSVVVRSGLTNGKIVTYCNSKNVIAHDGATFYYISGKATDLSSIELTEEVGELVAGYPYIVEAQKNEIRVVYGDKEQTTAQVYNGLHGVLGETVTLIDGDYLIKNNKYYRAHTGNNNTIVDGRAYLRLSEIEDVDIAPSEVTPAASPRRLRLGTDEVNISTGFNIVGESELGEPQKFIINNQVVIIRNGQMYNAQGALLK